MIWFNSRNFHKIFDGSAQNLEIYVIFSGISPPPPQKPAFLRAENKKRPPSGKTAAEKNADVLGD
ncbi:MAG: hypothetical protein SO063_12015 [Eubacteriales bacterium]|nr:hypothetical protein [Clostridiales bacterium]MDY5016768.1 hypothetical protein [Eubacteriales bacterium]